MKEILQKIQFSVITLLFFILLSASILSFALEKFTREENMKVFIRNFAIEQFKDNSDINMLYDLHTAQCKAGALEQNVPFENENKTLSCDEILQTTKEDYPVLIIDKFVFSPMYEKNYPCTFFQCLTNKETLPIIFSRQGNFFLSNLKIFLVIGAIIAALLVAVLSETIPKGLKSIGYTFAVVGGGYYFVDMFPAASFSLAESPISPEQISSQLFGPIKTASLILLVIGVVLWLTGVGISFYRGEGWLAKIFGRKK